MEWKEVTLGDFMQCNPKRTIKKGQKARKITMDLLIPHSKTIRNWNYEPYSGGAKFQNGDTIMARITPCLENGKHAFVSILNKGEIAYGSTEYFVFCGKEDVSDNDFVYYLTKTPLFRDTAIKSMVGSSGRQRAQMDVLENLKMLVPKDISDQRRIASILSSLDRKIELNNKINADLEEMAQAIFKNWFVDFEPFKDGKFVDSELGMIPEGWKVGTLGELCNFKRGKNLLTKNAIDEGVPVVAGGLEPSCYHNVANTGAPVITVSGSGANAGFTRMYHVPVWASDCSFIDISCENFYFVYCFLKVNSKLLKHAQTGAVQPHVKPSDIHDFELVIPDKESIYEFQDKIKPFFDKIAAIQKENSRLSLLRDTLLPRLMSGDLEVPE